MSNEEYILEDSDVGEMLLLAVSALNSGQNQVAIDTSDAVQILEAASSSFTANEQLRIKEQENAELREFNKKLLQELCSIQGQCIGELAMGYKLDAQSVGESISEVTGMTNPKLIKHLKLLNK